MTKKKLDIIEFALWIGIIISLNIIISFTVFRADFTEDKRYSIAEPSKEILSKINEPIKIQIFLTGDLNQNYSRLKKSIVEKIDQFNVYCNNNIEYTFTDPNAIEDKQYREQQFYQLAQRGITPKYYLEEKNGEKEEKYIFPGAIVAYKEKDAAVQFLKGSKILPEDQLLNQAVSGVEFELISAIRKLSNKDFKSIGIIEGHGELPAEEMLDFTNSLNENYSIERINLKSDTNISRFELLVVARPLNSWDDRDKFVFDQYVMKGGKALFFMDGVDVRRDSLKNGITYSLINDVNINDLLFKYGVRINTDLVQDMKSGVTRVQTGLNEETQLLNFPYYPILYNFSKHSIVKNLDALQSKFCSTIDTVKALGVNKTPLVFTSENTKIVPAPSEVSLNNLKNDINPETFNLRNLPVCYLLEGKFNSLYKNRFSPIPGSKIVTESPNNKIIVCADYDIIRNDFDYNKKMPIPLGYNLDMRYMFSNKDFALNCVDYLLNEKIINIRSKEIKLRPLDTIEIKDNRLKWQFINILAPILVVILAGIAIYYRRKKRYA